MDLLGSALLGMLRLLATYKKSKLCEKNYPAACVRL